MPKARVLIALTIAACSSNRDKPPPTQATPSDASVIDGITTFGSPDPNTHIDDDPTQPPVIRPKDKRPGRPIEILLRSSPNQAKVFVDGLEVGTTPTYWIGDTGAEHEFTFSLPKHALARYKFFPITSGTLHARLDPVANDVDAGIPPAGLVQPSPIPAPETLVTPAPTMAPDAELAPLAPPVTIDAAPMAPVDAANNSIGPTP